MRSELSATCLRAATPLIVAVLASMLFWPVLTSGQEQSATTLELNQPIERELSVGQMHVYQLTLAASRYLDAVVNQRGVDVEVTVIAPDGKKLLIADGPTGRRDSERVIVVTELAGLYRIEIRALEKDAPPGRYEIKLQELRAANNNDRLLSEALRLAYDSQRMESSGNRDEAIKLLTRAAELRERATGPEDRQVAAMLNNLAILHERKGDYPQAEALHLRVLAIREKTAGRDAPSVGASLLNLGLIYRLKGEYDKAAPMLERSLLILDKALGPDNLVLADVRDNLASVYLRMGDTAKAEPLYQRALEIREKARGPNHPLVAQSLNNLALLYDYRGEHAKAEAMHLRALAIKEKSLGTEHLDVSVTLGNLANLYYKTNDFAKAKTAGQRSLEITEKSLGPEHPDVAFPLNSLALILQREGDLASAEPLLRRALAIREKSLGPEHPEAAITLMNLFALYRAKRDWTTALDFLARAVEISERNLNRNLAAGSERQKLAYLELFANQTNNAVSLHAQFAPGNPEALRLAFTTLLRRKGRALDAMTDAIASLRRRASTEDQSLFDQLSTVRSQLATVTLKGAGASAPGAYRTQLKQLEEQVERFENELSARSSEFRAQTQPIAIDSLQSALPPDSALVEFASYAPITDLQTISKGPLRYVAYVLPQQGAVAWVDLGEVEEIDRAVNAWRQALRDKTRGDVKLRAREVDEKIMRPVRALLGKTRRAFISPEGSLNLIPFAALVDERDRYLVTRFTFSYLTSGRDLQRLQIPRQNKSEVLIIADPAFSQAVTAENQTGLASRFSRAQLRPLPGTAGEAQAIKRLLPQAVILTREQATEAAIKQAVSPRILHVATHGFFLKDVEAGTDNTRGLGLSLGNVPTTPFENPLLRSGLVLAEVNKLDNKSEDGILTALEAAGLDLWGTKLVVLSACDTGLGEVKIGDGVHGLRRALVLAGSESQVMSLWPVSDQGTRDLMIAYYRALQRGEGRSQALRQVQLRLLSSKNHRHPYYWASFIQSGEWKNLEGKQ